MDLSGLRAALPQEAARRGRCRGDGRADTGINIEQLRFRYRIEGDAPWKPRQVFDDGAKVYIQFPSGLAQSEAPPLFVIGPDGKPALVNYRVRGTTYIVDRLFAAAELRLARRRSASCASSAPMPSGGRRSHDDARSQQSHGSRG